MKAILMDDDSLSSLIRKDLAEWCRRNRTMLIVKFHIKTVQLKFRHWNRKNTFKVPFKEFREMMSLIEEVSERYALRLAHVETYYKLTFSLVRAEEDK